MTLDAGLLDDSTEGVRDAATRAIRALLNDLLEPGADVPSIAARIAIANVALMAAAVSIGTCTMDGTDMHYSGRSNGLFVCCSASPQHCWKVR
jgi:hypothetical protein